jgi:hypothetical protein
MRTALITVAIAAAGSVVISISITRTSVEPPAGSVKALTEALKTPWGEPDLQGIWMDEFDTPLQRPTEYADQEFFTEAQREKLDKERSEVGGDRRGERGTEFDVAGADNSVGWFAKRTGARTSQIIDPPDGRIPPLTPEARKAAAADREFRLALLQATATCKNKSAACAGGTYDPTPSRRRAELPPRYNATDYESYNRHDGPEDGSLGERCLIGGLPEFATSFGGGLRRIVQTPGGVSMFYEVPFGQGWQRNIIMDGSPHLPRDIRQWYGDSRGHWESNALVIDVTNFSPKTDFQGSRENLHLVERWTRTSQTTLEYVVIIEDPTVWTRPWTVRQEFTKQSEGENRIYYEPRCIEGNYGFPGLLSGARIEELAFAEGRGPDPATRDNIAGAMRADPLQGSTGQGSTGVFSHILMSFKTSLSTIRRATERMLQGGRQ